MITCACWTYPVFLQSHTFCDDILNNFFNSYSMLFFKLISKLSLYRNLVLRVYVCFSLQSGGQEMEITTSKYAKKGIDNDNAHCLPSLNAWLNIEGLKIKWKETSKRRAVNTYYLTINLRSFFLTLDWCFVCLACHLISKENVMYRNIYFSLNIDISKSSFFKPQG